jgi:hypothetical protein
MEEASQYIPQSPWHKDQIKDWWHQNGSACHLIQPRLWQTCEHQGTQTYKYILYKRKPGQEEILQEQKKRICNLKLTTLLHDELDNDLGRGPDQTWEHHLVCLLSPNLPEEYQTVARRLQVVVFKKPTEVEKNSPPCMQVQTE